VSLLVLCVTLPAWLAYSLSKDIDLDAIYSDFKRGAWDQRRLGSVISKHSYDSEKAVFNLTDVLASGAYSWEPHLRANHSVVLQELNAFENGNDVPLPQLNDVLLYTDNLNPKRKWQYIILRFCNRWTTNAAFFPSTKRLLEQGKWDISNAIISILEPGQVSPWHSGSYKGALRYHLGLEIPSYCKHSANESDPQCFLTVQNDDGNKETLGWQAGESLLFDDTFMHIAGNRGASRRVILWLGLVRYDFDWPMWILHHGFMKLPGIATALSRLGMTSHVQFEPTYAEQAIDHGLRSIFGIESLDKYLTRLFDPRQKLQERSRGDARGQPLFS
jgi:beta-hydroxylase